MQGGIQKVTKRRKAKLYFDWRDQRVGEVERLSSLPDGHVFVYLTDWKFQIKKIKGTRYLSIVKKM